MTTQQIILTIIITITITLILSTIFYFKPIIYGNTFTVAKKKRGKTLMLAISYLQKQKKHGDLKKCNEILERLHHGGYEKLQGNVRQLVYADVRLTTKTYHNKEILELEKKYKNGTITPDELAHLQKNVSAYLNGYNVGTKHTYNPLFADTTIPPYALIMFDEVNRYYDGRNAITFPDEVASFHQTNSHNNVSFRMTAHRPTDCDAKIREIMDYYETIRFLWIFKIPTIKNKKIKLKPFLVIMRYWHYTDYNEFEAKQKPHHLFTRIVRYMFGLPYESGRKLLIYWGNPFKHYDAYYLRPLHYDDNSKITYTLPPYHNYNKQQYNDMIKQMIIYKPANFTKLNKKERKENEKNGG